jgi:hypothetical protein
MDCGGVTEEIDHFHQGEHTYSEYEVFPGLTLVLCNICQVDFGSYDPVYFGLPKVAKLGLDKMVFKRAVDEPELSKDKYCPQCGRRLAFLKFVAAARAANAGGVSTGRGKDMSTQKMDQYTTSLIGQHLLEVFQQDFSWFFQFSGGVSISTESPWRMIRRDRIVVTSDDHGRGFALSKPTDAAALVQKNMAGRSVISGQISPAAGDLEVVFAGGARLQFLQLSAGYEAWRLTAPEGETICLGGGEISHFSQG